MLNVSDLCTKVVLMYLLYGATRGSDLIPITELFRVMSSPMKCARSHKSDVMVTFLSSNVEKNFEWLKSIVVSVVRFWIKIGVCIMQEVMLIGSFDQSAYSDLFL